MRAGRPYRSAAGGHFDRLVAGRRGEPPADRLICASCLLGVPLYRWRGFDLPILALLLFGLIALASGGVVKVLRSMKVSSPSML